MHCQKQKKHGNEQWTVWHTLPVAIASHAPTFIMQVSQSKAHLTVGTLHDSVFTHVNVVATTMAEYAL